MAEASCSNHPEIGAVGKCFRCEKRFCLDCLDLETGRPLCKNCLAGRAEAPVPSFPRPSTPEFAPPVSRPVPRPAPAAEDTAISLDDLNMAVKEPVETKEIPFKVSGPLSFMDVPPESAYLSSQPGELEVKAETAAVNPANPTSDPMVEKPPTVPSNLPPLAFPPVKSSEDDPLGLFKAPPALSAPVPEASKPAAPHPFMDVPEPVSGKPSHVSHFDLAGMMKKLDEAEQAAPKSAEFSPNALIPPSEQVSIRDLHAVKKTWFYPLQSFWGMLWLKFEIFSAKLKIPGYLSAAIIFALLTGGLTYFLQQADAPAIQVVDSIPQITIVPMDVSQVSNLDITAFTELYGHLGPLGFTQILQMTVPQLLPNFFDVGLKPGEGTYSEILVMPNQIGPRLSFVTVFTNGVWYSTNGWAGTNQQLDYLVSEFYPDQAPEQLYAKHRQGIQKLQTANGWQVQKAGQNRYIAELSDHLRWFLKFKNIDADQADFTSWH